MIILMGPAGSGKSTQGKRLAEATGRVWLSAGEILRGTGDPEVEAILEAGGLVPNELIERLMTEAMLEAVREGKDAIIDGFPREVEQAEWIAEKLASVIKLVIVIDVPKDELVRRLEARGRADDTKEAIEERFSVFEQNNCSICKVLSGAGICIKNVNGVGTEDEVFNRVVDTVDTAGLGAAVTGVEDENVGVEGEGNGVVEKSVENFGEGR